ncbi:MAG: DUF4981 domain-containing protein, partial [Clostridiales bacterium]|nr:DUF4981 domain-containing protein [Clostridiales bacterium]
AQPKLWSSEYPRLYTLLIEVLAADGRALEVIEQKVGFRRFEIVDGLMRLNGVRIVFKGVNRHDFCAETGRAVTEEKIRRDLITMKRNNINAVRTSHYPNHSALYRLCDELGLYLIDENNMETHGVWDMISRGRKDISFALPGDRPDWKDILFDRVNSVVQRDKNHPSVLMWSCGNESMGGSVILEMSRLFKKLDGTRPVHYEGVHWDPRYPETSDVYSQMYTPAADVRAFVRAHADKPFILCEYTHSMGNSNGGMHLYTELAYEEPRYQGGFIWDFLDQSIRTKDRFGAPYLNYGGDNGERPHDGNFNGNGIVYGDGSWSPKLQEIRFNYQNLVAKVGAADITIVNRSMFTPSSDYDCFVTLLRDGVPVEKRAVATDVPPLSEGAIEQPFAPGKKPGEYAVEVSFRLKEDTPWAERGREVAFGQGVIGAVPEKAAPMKHGALRVVRGSNNLGIFGDDFSAMFDLMAGGLTSYRYCGRELLKGMPQPNFWRAPTDNDRGWGMQAKLAFWKTASMYARAAGGIADSAGTVRKELPLTMNEDGSVTVTFNWKLPMAEQASCALQYTVWPCGRVGVCLAWDGDKSLPMMPEFSVLMKMDADYDDVTWYGLGPDENYIDRREGARLGLYKKKVRDNMARYLIPQECGNVTGVRFATVTDFKGRGLRFSGDGLEFSALPWTPHEVENALHSYELPPVNYTVLRVGLRQMGVAGDNSWGAMPLPEYTIDAAKPMKLEFCFEGILG